MTRALASTPGAAAHGRRGRPWGAATAPALRVARATLGAVLVVSALAGTPRPAAAHHVGAYTPRDNEVSANFKHLKASLQARKFDVALGLYEAGPLRRELRARAASLPPGLDAALLEAFRRGDAGRAEHGLLVFFAALIRDLAVDAGRRAADATAPPEARASAGQRFLDAIWRYYNLIDFALSQRDPTASTTVRLAFDEAEGYVRDGASPAPERLRAPLARIARVLTGVIETFPTSARRES